MVGGWWVGMMIDEIIVEMIRSIIDMMIIERSEEHTSDSSHIQKSRMPSSA